MLLLGWCFVASVVLCIHFHFFISFSCIVGYLEEKWVNFIAFNLAWGKAFSPPPPLNNDSLHSTLFYSCEGCRHAVRWIKLSVWTNSCETAGKSVLVHCEGILRVWDLSAAETNNRRSKSSTICCCCSQLSVRVMKGEIIAGLPMSMKRSVEIGHVTLHGLILPSRQQHLLWVSW